MAKTWQIIILLIVLGFQHYLLGAPANPGSLRVRILSILDCTYCEELKQSLLKEKMIFATHEGTYYTGQLPVIVNGTKKLVPIDFVETDSENLKKVLISPPLDTSRVRAFPLIQAYAGANLMGEGSPHGFATEMNVLYDAKDKAGTLATTIGSLNEFIDDEVAKTNGKPLSKAFKSPKRLVANKSQNFYTLKQICADSKKNSPKKKLALAVVKTHLCDTGTLVCLKTSALISDPANIFVQDNFSVYETRFIRQGELIQNSGERQIRSEFGKADSNPQYYVIDVNKCEILYNDYGMNAKDGMFMMEEGNRIYFHRNYISLRNLLLRDPRVAAIIGPKYEQDNLSQIKKELAYAKEYHEKNPQLSLHQVRMRLEELDNQLGLIQTSEIPEAYPDDLDNQETPN